MIRFASYSDIDEIVDMMEDHYHDVGSTSGYGVGFVRAVAEENLGNTIESDQGILLVSEVEGDLRGFFWGLVGPFVPWSPEITSVDVLFYVRPQYRGSITAAALIRNYITEAEMAGAETVRIGTASGVQEETTERLFYRLGFRPSAKQYIKE